MSSLRQWKVRPVIEAPRAGIWLGGGAVEGDGVWLGTLAERVSGRQPKVWVATGKEQVLAVVGKRGSGKSFTLGVLIEGLAGGVDSGLGTQSAPRATLVLDPLDTYWTTRYPVSESANPEAQRHFDMARGADLPGVEPDVVAWVPGVANRHAADPEWFKTLELSVPSLGLEEWELLLQTNVVSEPMGQALADAVGLVRDSGYSRQAQAVEASESFGLSELSDALKADELEPLYHRETLRALAQRLKALDNTGLFGQAGTPLGELLEPGRATVVLLSRLPQSYRSVVVAVLVRLLLQERGRTAFAEKRLALDPNLTEETRAQLEKVMREGVSRTVVVLDEAQSFLAPGTGSPARELFVRLVKEGRNMGLSAILATQQPSALDKRILSQVETFVAHQLVTAPDIRAVRQNLKSSLPDSLSFGKRELTVADLARELPPGSCIVSAADMNTSVRRALVVSVRPRATVHGGIEL